MIPHIPLGAAKQAWEIFGQPDTRKEEMRAAYEAELERIRSDLRAHESRVLDEAAFILRRHHDDTAACQEAADRCEVLAQELKDGRCC